MLLFVLPAAMEDSDHEYIGHGSDNDAEVNGSRRGQKQRPKERAQAKWEVAASGNWQLREAADGSIEGVLGGIEQAGKRQR